MCLLLVSMGRGSATVRNLPSPTRNCHSGPDGCSSVLLVSIMGITPLRLFPYGETPGYLDGGGRTLNPLEIKSAGIRGYNFVTSSLQHRERASCLVTKLFVGVRYGCWRHGEVCDGERTLSSGQVCGFSVGV